MKMLLAAILMLANTAGAVELSDEEEMRAQALMREIRCVACENEPISQSASDIANNMRLRVRELVAEGASDEEVRDWFADRYGEFVLFRPPARSPIDWALWLGPFLILLLAGGLVALARSGSGKRGHVEPVPPEDL